MTEKIVQFNFSFQIENCDALIQLKNGKIIIYNLTEFYNIHIYNEKTFHKLYEIDLYKTLYESEKNNEEPSTENDSILNNNKKNRKKNKNKNCFKELENNLLL